MGTSGDSPSQWVLGHSMRLPYQLRAATSTRHCTHPCHRGPFPGAYWHDGRRAALRRRHGLQQEAERRLPRQQSRRGLRAGLHSRDGRPSALLRGAPPNDMGRATARSRRGHRSRGQQPVVGPPARDHQVRRARGRPSELVDWSSIFDSVVPRKYQKHAGPDGDVPDVEMAPSQKARTSTSAWPSTKPSGVQIHKPRAPVTHARGDRSLRRRGFRCVRWPRPVRR